MEHPVIDGFLFRRDLRCNLTFLSMAVDQYEALRRAGFYRSKQWCIPRDSNVLRIPARDSYEYELRVGVGAVIWGYTFAANNQAYQVQDACNDQPLFDEPNAQRFSLWFGDMNWGGQQTMLAKPIVVATPGIIVATLANQTGEDAVGQLIIYGGVPVSEG